MAQKTQGKVANKPVVSMADSMLKSGVTGRFVGTPETRAAAAKSFRNVKLTHFSKSGKIISQDSK